MTTRAPGVSYTEEDAYGQVHPVETPEIIARFLKELDAELDKLPAAAKLSWNQALVRCPKLTGDDHRLMFLRCELFNANLAANRLTDYWEKRVEIYGPDKAFLRLTLNGALKDDEVPLGFGFIRLVVGAKDPSGRSIVFADPSRQDRSQYSRESMLRGLWYVMHAALEDTDTQKRGVVLVANPSKAKFSQFDRVQDQMNIDSIKGRLPIRISAIHICHPPTFFAIIFPIIKLFLGARLRKRLKVHSGSQNKVLTKLAKYGLTVDVLPTGLGGQISLDHEGWLEERRANDM